CARYSFYAMDYW
nr:immunoglobulin heavy chain junction region [Mus musculus]